VCVALVLDMRLFAQPATRLGRPIRGSY
jgi:hypothetical protein